jgi:short-subunit dehydrogenase involved in D-alanine esterification of teichoic acids
METLSKVGDGVLLKMDIEGGEYETILEILDASQRIEAICIEFHDVVTNRQRFLEIVTLLLRDFAIVHMHINNAGMITNNIPNILELTFTKYDYVDTETIDYNLPLTNLDYPNSPRKMDYGVIF